MVYSAGLSFRKAPGFFVSDAKNFMSKGNILFVREKHTDRYTFCSPFIAKFRLAANHADKTLDPYPAYALIYGSSKAGKTTFVKTLYKMTFGIKKISHAGSFTAKQVEDLKRCVKGIPLFYDDIISKTFNEHAVKLVKHEDFGLDDFLDAYPCVLITGNDDVKAVEQYVSRRVALCHEQQASRICSLSKTPLLKPSRRKLEQHYIENIFVE